MADHVPQELVTTGIAELDQILGGGLRATGCIWSKAIRVLAKLRWACSFCSKASATRSAVLYVTLSETREELSAVVSSHGWSLEGLDVCELMPSEESLLPDAQTRMFHPSEVELSETTKAVLSEVERIRPSRVVFDSLSELRLLAQNPLRYRRQILALKQFFVGRQCTVLLLDDRTSESYDLQLHSLAHGVVTLEQLAPDFGAERRRLRVVKMRGKPFRGGYHDFSITYGGLSVFPRLIAAEHRQPFERGQLASGVPELDQLLAGGFDLGTSALLMGPAGSGKSSLAIQYCMAAVRRGEHAVMFTFDESLTTLLTRSASLGMPLEEHVQAGRLLVQQIDPAEQSPGEFAHLVRQTVQRHGTRVVVIDSLNGYLNAMPNERLFADPTARAAHVSRPVGDRELPGHGAARPVGQRNAKPGGCQLSGRFGAAAALLRSFGRTAASDFRGEKAQRRTPGQPPRIPFEPCGDLDRRASERFSRRADRHSHVHQTG